MIYSNLMKQHTYFLIILSLFVCFSIHAQEKKSTMDLLTAHAWVTKDSTEYVKFDKETFYNYCNFKKWGYKESYYTYKYYISDNSNFIKGNKYNKIDFKEELIGKVQNGNYFITSVRSFWIIEISENSLTIIALALGAIRLSFVPYYGEFPNI